jgi:GPI ethanolamine phosphate transferase 1
MAGISRAGFLAIAVIFHLAYIFSIFDIYFVSPIVSGMRLVPLERPSTNKAPADRLVLFVGRPCPIDFLVTCPFPPPHAKFMQADGLASQGMDFALTKLSNSSRIHILNPMQT